MPIPLSVIEPRYPNWRASLAVLVAAALLWPTPGAQAVPPSVPCAPGEAVTLAPPASGAYHSAFPYFGHGEDNVSAYKLDRFISLAGTGVVGAYMSDHWGRDGRVGIRFPLASVEAIWNHGQVPMVRMMPWTERWLTPDPTITMQKVVDGRYDRRLKEWFRDARDAGIPLVIEFGVEVTGDWFSWNGRWNGGGETDGYGRRSYPDGPERFRDAYRHVVDLSRAVGADDLLTWAFHPDVGWWPHVSWNRMKWYYPGNGYVDWMFLSAYGEQVPTGNPARWETFHDVLGDPDDPQSPFSQFSRLAGSQPTALIEFGVTEDPGAGDKASWITEAFSAIEDGDYPGFDMVSWWHERWDNGGGRISDLRINSSPEALAAYRAAAGAPFFTTTPTFACG